MKIKLLSVILSLLTFPIFAQNGCGGNFYDNGGATGNYLNDSNQEVTICPNIPGSLVQVHFTSFDVQQNFDGLYVFDGNSTADPLIASPNPGFNIPGGVPGAYWGSEIPGPFVSSSPDGCLTFKFVSNGTITSEGWIADVICGPPAECTIPPSNFTVSGVNSTSAVIAWNQGGWGWISSWEILALPCGLPPPTAATSGIYTNSNPFVMTGLTPGVCYQFFVRTWCSPSDFSPWSNPTIATTTSGVAIGLAAFLDQNSNGTKEVSEPIVNYGNFVVQENNSGDDLFIDVPNGSYSFEVSDVENTHDLSYSIDSYFTTYFSSATSFDDISVAAGSGLTTFYFPINVDNPFNDVSVHIVPLSNAQPGFTYENAIVYKNLGLFAASGSITFTKDPALSIVSISEAGAVNTSDGFTYSFADLQPNETRMINVSLLVPTIPTISLGSLLTNSVVISPTTADINLANNSYALLTTVVGSYDPNDITESHGPQIVFSEFDSNDYLYYTIRFQNTGTANATTVRVENLLDGQLDPASISMVSSSHNYSMTRSGNQLTWQFDDIQLVPDSVNNDDSQGYVLYKVKPMPGYAIGDIIPSGAEIYFDFNPAIVTETFTTEFVSQLSVADLSLDSIRLYPNPAKSIVNVSTGNNSQISSVNVYDLLGKVLIQTSAIASNEFALDVSSLSKGIYTVVITTSEKLKTVKKLIVQ